MLKTWCVDEGGSYIDGQPLSTVTIDELRLLDSLAVGVRIGVKSDAKNVGGINLFGRGFGNHAQDIVLELTY